MPAPTPTPARDEELELVLAALAFYAPDYSVTVRPFAAAHQQACRVLEARGIKPSPLELGALTSRWSRPLVERAHAREVNRLLRATERKR